MYVTSSAFPVSVSSFNFNRFNPNTGPVFKQVSIDLWKKDPLFSKDLSISPNTEIIVVGSGMYTGVLKGPLFEKPTTNLIV